MTKVKSSDSWFVKRLIEMGACGEAIKYARKYRTFPAAYNACESSSWLCWLLQKIDSSYGCGKVPHYEIQSRFPADRVSKALRKL